MRSDSKLFGVGSVIAAPGTATGYRLVAKRGWGGFAEVWEAEAPGGFRVALRIVRSSAERQASEQRAIEVIRGIRHPHLLPIFGAWQEEGVLVIGMELAECSLWERFTSACAEGLRGIPRRELLSYLAGAAAAVDFLNAPRHAIGERTDVGIQHRDLKPRNILLFGRCAKVGDFGMVRVLDGSVTGRGGMWTLAYAAPEFFSAKVASQSDQYSLATTYCHMRGGLLPFRGNAAEVMAGHMFGTPDLSRLPEAERPIVARALAKSPEERWPDCRTFIEELAALANSSDDLDRLPDENAAEFDGNGVFPQQVDPSADDFSAVSDFQLTPSQESVSAWSPDPAMVSDFHVLAQQSGEASVSDFQLLSRWSGETAVSDFQVLSRWSGETSTVSAPAHPAEATATGDGRARWSGLLVPCFILLFAVGVTLLAYWPHAQRTALARRTKPAAVRTAAQTPAVARTPEKPARPAVADKSPTTRHVVAKPPAPTPTDEPVVAVPETPAAAPETPKSEQATDAKHDTPQPAPTPASPRAKEAPSAVALRLEPLPAPPAQDDSADRAKAAYEQGRDHLARGAYADSIAAFTQALEHDSGHTDARFSRGVAHHLNDRYAEALADYGAVIKQRPDHATALLLRARVHRALGALDRALADLDSVVRLRPDDAAAYAERAGVHHHAGTYDQALSDFSAAIRLRPDDPVAYYRRGLVRYHSGDHRGAVEDFDHALTLDPRRAEVYLARSEAYARLGQFARAASDHDTFDRLVASAGRGGPTNSPRAMGTPAPVR